jgi:hypothetical protein
VDVQIGSEIGLAAVGSRIRNTAKYAGSVIPIGWWQPARATALDRSVEFEPIGQPDPANGKGVPARGQLYINRKLVASIDMPHSVPAMYGTEGLSCGYDGGSPVAPEEYTDEFRFTGTIKRVTIDLSGELIPDSEMDMKIAMMRQ